MATGQEVLNQALLLLDYTGRYAGGQAAMARRGLAAVNQAYCDLWHIEGRGAFVPLRTLDGVLELSERACADILPYGTAMFLAQAFQNKKDYAKAKTYLNEALDVEKDPAERQKLLVRIALVGLVSNDIPGAAAAARQARDLDPEDGVPYFILAQCYASSAGSCGGFAGLATYWAAYDTMAKAVELLPADSEYMEHAKSSLGKFRSVFPSSEECFFNELQEGARYTVTCGTAAGITTTVRAR